MKKTRAQYTQMQLRLYKSVRPHGNNNSMAPETVIPGHESIKSIYSELTVADAEATLPRGLFVNEDTVKQVETPAIKLMYHFKDGIRCASLPTHTLLSKKRSKMTNSLTNKTSWGYYITWDYWYNGDSVGNVTFKAGPILNPHAARKPLRD